MKTPPYAPKFPVLHNSRYDENVKNYGPAPRGYRWRSVGESYQADDLYATDTFWHKLSSQAVIERTTYPIATPVKVLVKRDSRGRFAPEATKKVDLGPEFRRQIVRLRDANDRISHIKRVLADPVKNRLDVVGCFEWNATPQGTLYWNERYKNVEQLSPEDLDYLRAAKEFFEKRIVELTPPKPTPAPSPTVPELQAKILSLETELASLRRKIAGATVTFPS